MIQQLNDRFKLFCIPFFTELTNDRFSLLTQIFNKKSQFLFQVVIGSISLASCVRCKGLCHYYQGEHNNSEEPEKREKTNRGG
jgi:hypothetical protein